MQHTFASSDGPVEVTLTRDGEAFVLEGQTLAQHNRGRLHLTLRDGRTCLAPAAKVGDVWWIHLNGRTYKWERIEPGSSGAEDEGGDWSRRCPARCLKCSWRRVTSSKRGRHSWCSRR